MTPTHIIIAVAALAVASCGTVDVSGGCYEPKQEHTCPSESELTELPHLDQVSCLAPGESRMVRHGLHREYDAESGELITEQNFVWDQPHGMHVTWARGGQGWESVTCWEAGLAVWIVRNEPGVDELELVLCQPCG